MSPTKALRLAVSGLLLGWIAWQTDWPSVRQAFSVLKVEYWVAALGLLLAAQVVSTIRWQRFASALRFPQRMPSMIAYYFIGMFFNLVLPTSVGGDVIRAWYLNGNSGRKAAAFASVFLDRLNGLFVLVAMACLAVMLAPVQLPAWVPLSVWCIAGCGVVGLLLLPLAIRFAQIPARRLRQLQTLLHLLKEPRTLAIATLLSVFVQAASVGIVWLLGKGLHLPIPAAYYWIFVPMVSLLTLLPVSVNGMGVREGGVVLFLAPLDVPHATALTLAFLWFLVYAAGGLLGGAVYLAGAFPKPEAITDVPAAEEVIAYGPIAGDPDQRRAGQRGRAA